MSLYMVALTPERGWAWLIYADQSHYFVEGVSLCKRWVLPHGRMTPLENWSHFHESNCIECKEIRKDRYAHEY